VHCPDSSTKAAQALAGTERSYCEVMGELTSPYVLQRGESMAEARIEIFKKMINDDPNNTTIRFGLANELFKLERFEEAANELKAYLSQTDDQGNAYGKLAQALERLGRIEEAREAYHQGIIAANRHGHPGMAQDFEMALDDLI
jgi:E3 SUMO-protein ligase RanBP2